MHARVACCSTGPGDVLLFVLVVVVAGARIALHEIGHLVPAKKFGVKVTQYMVGFGPTVWSRRRGETEYGIKAIPLGGYVRMIGMLPPRARRQARRAAHALDRPVQRRWSTRRGPTPWRRSSPGDEDRVFYKLHPVRRRSSSCSAARS